LEGHDSPAAQLFEDLAVELEEGQGDPEAFFAAHPDSEPELRLLYRGWLRVDVLFRDLASADSLVGAVRQEFGSEVEEKRLDAVLARLAVRGFGERYEVGDELGSGGMGVVRRVTDRVLGRELAMKVIQPVEPRRRARLLRRFLEEAEVIGRLEHPGIVPIHELGLDSQGQVYFTMPLVRGRTLQEILKLASEGREGWTLTRVLEVLLRAVDAVAYAHSRGVLHRDLKPANVMVGRFGEVYVMDWGLARSLGGAETSSESAPHERSGPLTLEGEVLGTPAYMAPEQALGRSEDLDERCDVYAFGAILYEALAGVRPYGECSSAEALERLGQAAPAAVEKLTSGASEELCAIVQRAMAREREKRYPSVAMLAGDLRAYLEGRVVQAHRTGPWVEAKKWVQRNRRLACLRIKGKGGPFGKKTKARVVPVSRRVMTLLEAYFALRDKMPLGTRAVQKLVKNVANKAGITKDVTPHVLRHTWATLSLQRGVSLAALQRALGHDRLETTAIYLNLTDEHVVAEFHEKTGSAVRGHEPARISDTKGGRTSSSR
jgi:hypothetical protein